jgi:hypothetical protein
MEDFAIAAGLVLGAACWWGVVRCMRINGRPWWRRHLVGLTLAPFGIAGFMYLFSALAGSEWEASGEPLGLAGAVGGLMVALPMLIPLAVSWRETRRRRRTGVQSPVVREFIDDVEQAAREASATEAVARPDSPVTVPAKREQWSASYSVPIRFVYKDSSGNVSTRDVSSWKVAGDRLRGHCHERGMVRTFRTDRIVEVLEGAEALAEARRSPRPDQAEPTPDRQRQGVPEIHFSGFDQHTRQTLEKTAAAHGFKVRKSVTKNLDFFCRGARPSQEKLAKAEAKPGCTVIDKDGFLWVVATGEIPK